VATPQSEDGEADDGGAEVELITPVESFAELHKAWVQVRPWADNDDREAMRSYAIALREVEPDAILAAAQAYLEGLDAPRYAQKLSKWLADRCWERNPPQKRQPREARGRYRSKHKPDLFKIALKAGGYVEGEDGSLMWGGAIQ
jgi:hypothetical protein